MDVKFEKLVKDVYLEALGDGRYIYLTGSGSSMSPFLKNNDILTIESSKNGLEIGDIAMVAIASEEKMKFLAHRIVDIKNENSKISFFLKGDNSTGGIQGPMPREKIKGRVREIGRGDLSFDFSTSLMKRLNIFIAHLSYKMPQLLIASKRIIDLLIEWPWILKKIKTHIKKGREPFLYNAEELLLILAKNNLNQEAMNKAIVIIREGLYWTRFCELAGKQGAATLVYNSLKKIEKHIQTPQFVKETLKNSYLYVTSKNTAHHEREKDILQIFFNNSIPVIPLKGMILSKRLYEDIAARGLSADFDLLIEEKNKERVQILLQEAGYSFNPDDEIKQWQWQHAFFKSKAMMIDLHWDITMMGRNKERIGGLWRGIRRVEEDSIGYYEFKEEELLLYLSVHLVNSSRFNQWRYVCDINGLLFKYKHLLDWSSIIKKAKRWRVSNSLYAALKLSKDFFSADLPSEVLRKLKPNILILILIKIFVNKKVILRGGLRRRLINSFLSYIFFELIEARGFSEYQAIIKRVLFPPKEALFNTRYNSSRPIFMRYIIRIFKGVFKVLRIKSFYK